MERERVGFEGRERKVGRVKKGRKVERKEGREEGRREGRKWGNQRRSSGGSRACPALAPGFRAQHLSGQAA